MIVRIVKMNFQKDRIHEFQQLFDQVKSKIIEQEGCQYLELLQDCDCPEIFMTYSHWKDLAALNNYKNSVFFRQTWNRVKKMFNQPAVAWSLNKYSDA